MAINAATAWEVRTTGAQTNGGGYANLVPGTSVDYSQQDSAQLSRTHIATDGAGTGLSSATGGFTAAMQGNCIYLTGGSVTAGWYQITAYGSGNAVTIDRSAGANKTGVTGKVGGAFAWGGSLDDAFIDAAAAGNLIWVKAGTYTLSGASRSSAGSSTALTKLIGYNAARGDDPKGDSRPLIACGANIFQFGGSDHAIIDLRFTTVDSTGIGFGLLASNCKSTNSSGTSNRPGFTGGTACRGCEGISTKGRAFNSIEELWSCYAHDSDVGAYLTRLVAFSVLETCTSYGAYFASIYGERLYQCTIYNCGTGVYGASSASQLLAVIGCIFHTCTVGIDGSAASAHAWIWNNCFYNNGTDIADYTDHLANNLYTDPGLNDPANGDFSIDTDDPVYEASLNVMDYVTSGLTV